MTKKKNLGYGSTSQKRARQLLEALLDYESGELEGSERIHGKLRVKLTAEDDSQLEVEATLDTLRQLYDIKYPPRNDEKTREYQQKRKRQLNDVLTYYFKDFLDILEDRRVGRKGNERKQGLGDWNFVLKLWSSDKYDNLERFDQEWQAKRQQKLIKSAQNWWIHESHVSSPSEALKSHSCSKKVPEMPPPLPSLPIIGTVAFSSESPKPEIFNTIPQVVEVRNYFQQRWQPQKDLRRTLEYRLVIAPDGSVETIIPLGQAAQVMIEKIGVPLVGKPFVSSLIGKSHIKIRLILTPDGQVEAFLEPMN